MASIDPSPAAAPWPATIDEILAGDQVVAMGQVTPASGVVLNPLTNFGIRDPAAGALTPLSSSVAMWKKLHRLQENPRVAVAYHSRDHGFSERPEYVLVQGTASLSSFDDHTWLERHRDSWERFAGPRDVGPLWERWLRVYHWRIGIHIEVERVIVWPDLACRGLAQVHGTPLPSAAVPGQRPPRNGTEPRVNHGRAARRAAQLGDVLLGWVGADGFPVVVPVAVLGTEPAGILLDAPRGWVPPGGRRAGLTAHTFTRFAYGQHQRKHTGWLEADSDQAHVLYAPHTRHGHYLPPSQAFYRLTAGLVTRRGHREGVRAGLLPEGFP
jgi:hypothetical protein